MASRDEYFHLEESHIVQGKLITLTINALHTCTNPDCPAATDEDHVPFSMEVERAFRRMDAEDIEYFDGPAHTLARREANEIRHKQFIKWTTQMYSCIAWDGRCWGHTITYDNPFHEYNTRISIDDVSRFAPGSWMHAEHVNGYRNG